MPPGRPKPVPTIIPGTEASGIGSGSLPRAELGVREILSAESLTCRLLHFSCFQMPFSFASDLPHLFPARFSYVFYKIQNTSTTTLSRIPPCY